jgi:hypothetical protein
MGRRISTRRLGRPVHDEAIITKDLRNSQNLLSDLAICYGPNVHKTLEGITVPIGIASLAPDYPIV